MKAMKAKATKKPKLTVKEKVAIAAFMEAFPRLKEMWEISELYSTTKFDEWLQRIYDDYQKRKKGEKTE